MAKKTKDTDFLKEKLDRIKDALDLARGVLREAPNKKTKKSVKAAFNVYHIRPYITVEYSVFEDKKNDKTVIELLDKYEEWSQEICKAIVYSNEVLKNKKLNEHLSTQLSLCETLNYSFRTIFEINK